MSANTPKKLQRCLVVAISATMLLPHADAAGSLAGSGAGLLFHRCTASREQLASEVARHFKADHSALLSLNPVTISCETGGTGLYANLTPHLSMEGVEPALRLRRASAEAEAIHANSTWAGTSMRTFSPLATCVLRAPTSSLTPRRPHDASLMLQG